MGDCHVGRPVSYLMRASKGAIFRLRFDFEIHSPLHPHPYTAMHTTVSKPATTSDVIGTRSPRKAVISLHVVLGTARFSVASLTSSALRRQLLPPSSARFFGSYGPWIEARCTGWTNLSIGWRQSQARSISYCLSRSTLDGLHPIIAGCASPTIAWTWQRCWASPYPPPVGVCHLCQFLLHSFVRFPGFKGS